MPRKGDHEHAREQSYIDFRPPVYGATSWSTVGFVFRSTLIFSVRILHACLGLGVYSPSEDGHVPASKSGPFIRAGVPKSGLLGHFQR